jgi:hypothetical protein
MTLRLAKGPSLRCGGAESSCAVGNALSWERKSTEVVAGLSVPTLVHHLPTATLSGP